MGKRSTKKDEIIKDSEKRIASAQYLYQAAFDALSIAEAKLEAYKETHRSLLTAFDTKPRSNGSGSAPKPKRASKAAATAMTEVVQGKTPCSTCGEPDNHWSHDSSYGASHPFAPSSAAPNAKRKSSSASVSKKDGEANLSANDTNVLVASNVEGSE